MQLCPYRVAYAVISRNSENEKKDFCIMLFRKIMHIVSCERIINQK